MNYVVRWFTVIGVMFLMGGCAPASPTTSPTSAAVAPAKPTTATAAVAPPASDAAQWEKDTYQAASKEGKVVVYGFWSPSLEKTVGDFITQRYPGVKLETLTSTTAADKIRTEQQSGQYTADVYLGGQTTGLQLSQLKLSEEFKPPAENAAGVKWVVAPSSYTSYPQIIYALQGKGILINTQLVPPDKEPKNWTDLLNPFWADKKIVIDHPGRGGGPGSSWARWADESPDLGRAFLTGLKGQDPVLASGSATPQIEALARGEYFAYIPAYPSSLVQAQGAPVKFIWPGPATSGTTSLLILIKNAPHPNAAKLFLNMSLLPEFQKAIADDQWTGPNLLGVPVANALVSLEGRKVYIDKEADIARTTDWANSVGKEIFGN